MNSLVYLLSSDYHRRWRFVSDLTGAPVLLNLQVQEAHALQLHQALLDVQTATPRQGHAKSLVRAISCGSRWGVSFSLELSPASTESGRDNLRWHVESWDTLTVIV